MRCSVVLEHILEPSPLKPPQIRSCLKTLSKLFLALACRSSFLVSCQWGLCQTNTSGNSPALRSHVLQATLIPYQTIVFSCCVLSLQSFSAEIWQCMPATTNSPRIGHLSGGSRSFATDKGKNSFCFNIAPGTVTSLRRKSGNRYLVALQERAWNLKLRQGWKILQLGK